MTQKNPFWASCLHFGATVLTAYENLNCCLTNPVIVSIVQTASLTQLLSKPSYKELYEKMSPFQALRVSLIVHFCLEEHYF